MVEFQLSGALEVPAILNPQRIEWLRFGRVAAGASRRPSDCCVVRSAFFARRLLLMKVVFSKFLPFPKTDQRIESQFPKK